MSYTSKTKIELYLGIDIGTELTTQLERWISSAEQVINNYCDTSFEATALTDRYFNGEGCAEILTPWFVRGSETISTLNYDGTVDKTLTSGDYYAEPNWGDGANNIILSPNSSIADFGDFTRSVKVNAKWGFSETVPNDIEFVATKLVASILERAIDGGKLDGTKLGEYEADFKDIDEHKDPLGIFRILDHYRISVL